MPWEFQETLESQIREQIEKAVDALGFENCPLDFDCMLKDGKVYIIEATGRAGATCITDTVGIYYGIDYFEAIVRVALGMDVTELFLGPQVPRTPSVTRLLSVEQEGIVESIHIPEHLPEQVVDLSFNIRKGSQVRPMTNGADRVGQLIVKGKTLEECRSKVSEVLGTLNYEIKKNGENEGE